MDDELLKLTHSLCLYLINSCITIQACLAEKRTIWSDVQYVYYSMWIYEINYNMDTAWQKPVQRCMHGCTDSVGADKSTVQPTDPLCCFAYRVSVQQSLHFIMTATPIQDDILTRTFIQSSLHGIYSFMTGHDLEITLFCIILFYSSCMTMHLFFLTVTLLMASPQVSASVSNSFKSCSHFFYMQTPPAGIKGTSLRRVCQKYTDKLRYATLYDSSRRIPLYSAYIFKKSDGKRRMDTPWMYEPQVETNEFSLFVT